MGQLIVALMNVIAKRYLQNLMSNTNCWHIIPCYYNSVVGIPVCSDQQYRNINNIVLFMIGKKIIITN